MSTTLPFVVIHSYGKVASTALRAALIEGYPTQFGYSHGLQPRFLRTMEGFLASTTTDVGVMPSLVENARAIWTDLQDRIRDGHDIVLLTGVRDPITWSLSAAMQTLQNVFADTVEADPIATAEHMRLKLRDLWTSGADEPKSSQPIADYLIRAPFVWLREEIEEPFGFDLLSQPFDPKRGYKLLSNGRVQLLLYRQEDAPGGLQAGLDHLFPALNLRLSRANEGDTKESATVYRHLKQIFTLTRDCLERIYDNPYIRHFYSQAEIDASILRWADRQEVATPREGEPRLPAATVLVPLLNTESYIEELLESILGQWRDDFELLVLDDGSTDRGLQRARDTVARHPDVSATFLRSADTLGIGQLPVLLAHARGRIIIQADSDDIALPDRLNSIMACFEADKACKLVTSNAVLISSDNVPMRIYDPATADQVVRAPYGNALGSSQWLGATSAFDRSLLEYFPPLDPELFPYALDLLLPFRATLTGSHHYLSTPLVAWRQHGGNTHRRAGAGSARDAALERHGAFELMALAQRIRDVDFVRSRPGTAAHTLDTVAAQCHDLFLSHFATWSRARNRLAQSANGSEAGLGEFKPAALPPLMTLQPGKRYFFGTAGMLGRVAGSWSGIHEPEELWNWTQRSALIAFTVPRAGRLSVRLGASSVIHAQDIQICVNFDRFQNTTIGQEETVVDISTADAKTHDILTLVIHAPAAVQPSEIAASIDARLLGIQLLWVEISC